MSSAYLDTFRGALTRTQGRQINELLRQKRDRGEIITLQEYRDELAKLTKQLVSEVSKPTLKLYESPPGDLIVSETYDEMLRRIQADLEAAFLEANVIAQVQEAHDVIIRQAALTTMRRAVAELEERVQELRLLNSTNPLFRASTVQSNTFSTARELRADRSPELAGLFIDPATNEPITSQQDASVEAIGERLTLATDEVAYTRIMEARQIFDDVARQSEVLVEYPGNDIRRAIDGSAGTYWLYSLLQRVGTTNPPARARFELSLAGASEINFLEIEPASPFPMVLEELLYLGPDQVLTPILTTAQSREIPGPTRISFSQVIASKLYLTVRQNNFVESQFEIRPGQSTFFRAASGEEVAPGLAEIEPYLRATFSSATILQDGFGLGPETAGESRRYLEYTIGFDNIRTGKALYAKKSIFISSPLEVSKPTGGFLIAREARDASTSFLVLDLQTPPPFFHGSIEYYLNKKNLDSSGAVIDQDFFPILPIGQTGVAHERLLLTERIAPETIDNVGFLRFFPIDTSVVVYRNGSTLPLSGDLLADAWSFSDVLSVLTPLTGQKMIRAIRIHRPSTSDIYTTSYTPSLSSSSRIPAGTGALAQIVDMVGDGSARIGGGNITSFETKKGNRQIEKSVLHLVILLRGNSPVDSVSPAVTDYTLGVAQAEEDRFSSGA